MFADINGKIEVLLVTADTYLNIVFISKFKKKLRIKTNLTLPSLCDQFEHHGRQLCQKETGSERINLGDRVLGYMYIWL